MVLLFCWAASQAATQPVAPHPWSDEHIVTTLLLQSTTLCRSAEQWVAQVPPASAPVRVIPPPMPLPPPLPPAPPLPVLFPAPVVNPFLPAVAEHAATIVTTPT